MENSTGSSTEPAHNPHFKGSLPVAPNAVRVWRGFRADPSEAGWQKFLDFLNQTLYPVEATWRPAFGLTCYLTGIKSPNADPRAPDEFALVFYESQGVYDAGLQTVAGSLYPLFPAPAFAAKGGRSGYPERLQKSFALNTPYYLFGASVDWYHGQVCCYLGTTLPAQNVISLAEAVEQVLRALQAAPPAGLDGLIAMVDASWQDDGSGYLLLWAHWQPGHVPAPGFLDQLSALTQAQFSKSETHPMNVSGGFYQPGVTVSPSLIGDQLLRLQFLRRKLAQENGLVVAGPWPG